MKVLTVIAHPHSKSFCHAVLRRFSEGLAAAGRESEVDDEVRRGYLERAFTLGKEFARS